jgi:hypothetical protein
VAPNPEEVLVLAQELALGVRADVGVHAVLPQPGRRRLCAVGGGLSVGGLSEVVLVGFSGGKDLEGLVRLERVAQPDLVFGEDPDHVLVVLLQVPDGELLHPLGHPADLHPHRLLGVPDGDVVAEERRPSVPLRDAPLDDDRVGADGADLEGRRGRRRHRCVAPQLDHLGRGGHAEADGVLGEHPEHVLALLLQVLEGVLEAVGLQGVHFLPFGHVLELLLDDVAGDLGAAVAEGRLPGECGAAALHVADREIDWRRGRRCKTRNQRVRGQEGGTHSWCTV